MAQWHSKTNDKFGLFEDACYDTWTDYYKPFAAQILESTREYNDKGELDDDTFETLEKAFSHFDYIFSEPVEKASLIHGDLNVMNIMADKKLNPAVAQKAWNLQQ